MIIDIERLFYLRGPKKGLINIKRLEAACYCKSHYYKEPYRKDLHVYILESPTRKILKVGVSIDPKRRVKELARSTPFKFKHNYTIRFKQAWSALVIERLFTKTSRVKKPQFKKGFSGSTEWFYINDYALETIEKVLTSKVLGSNIEVINPLQNK